VREMDPRRLRPIASRLLLAPRVAAVVCVLGVAVSSAAWAETTVARVSKTPPVFRAGGQARIGVDVEVKGEVDPDLYLVAGVSDRTRLRGNMHVLMAERLGAVDLRPGRQRKHLSVSLPPSLGTGTFYVYGAIATAPRLDADSVVSYSANKVAVLDWDLEALSLPEVLIPSFLDATAAPDLGALRAHLLDRRKALSAEVVGPNPDAVEDPIRLADAYLRDGRFALKFSTAQYMPGPAFWESREHVSDSLEVHSLRFIQVLVLAYDQTGNTSYLDAAVQLHADWAAHNLIDSYQCPYAWSDHGTAIRLRSIVALATRLAEHSKYDSSLQLLLSDIYRHSEILATWGFYSSWSNHGLFQDDALVAASVICDVFERSRDWRERAIHRTRNWFSGKVYADGGLNEGSSGYQLRVLGLGLRVRELAAAVGAFDSDLDDLLSRMAFFAKHLTRPNGRLVMFGDTGYGSPEDSPRGDTEATAPLRRRIPEAGQQLGTHVGVFPLSGYAFCISDCLYDVDDFYLGFDFGQSTRATHYQDDTMNFELMLAGATLVQDSGIFDYAGGEINRYCKSARAHNTVVFGDWSQSPYAYREIQETVIERYWSTDDCFEFTARMVTADGSELRRTVRGYPKDNVLFVRDRFRTAVEGGVTFLFHYGADSEAALADGRVDLTLPNGRFSHVILSDSVPIVTLHKGETEPAFLGWITLSAGTKEPRWTAMVSLTEAEGELISVFARADTDISPYLSGSAEGISSQRRIRLPE